MCTTKKIMPFLHPTTIIIAGPTMSGKTQFMLNMLASHSIHPFPQRMIVVYSEWQPLYDQLKATASRDVNFPKLEFTTNFNQGTYDSLNSKVRNLVLLDDQMETATGKSAPILSKYFTQGAHHRNLTVVYIVQNLYHKDRVMRTISLNAHYTVVFKSPKDKSQIMTLGRQMFPGNSSFLTSAYNDATDAPYSYLVIDSRPSTPDKLRIRAQVLGDESPTFYVCRRDVYKR